MKERYDEMPKGRESGMPEAEMWQGFFYPARILDQLDCDHPGNVVEFGCGYGLFTVEAARRTSGTAYAMDIDPEMIAATKTAAEKTGMANVRPLQRDLVADGTGLPTGSCDYAMVFNLLHIDDPVALLGEAFRVLMPAGKLGIIHWNVDPATPRGPSMEIRPTPEQCRTWAEEAGFCFIRHEPGIARWHWGLLMHRPYKPCFNSQPALASLCSPQGWSVPPSGCGSAGGRSTFYCRGGVRLSAGPTLHTLATRRRRFRHCRRLHVMTGATGPQRVHNGPSILNQPGCSRAGPRGYQ